MYLSPLVTKVVPVSQATFMHVVGVVEIIAGIIVLTRWTKMGSYVVMAWLLCIALNLLTPGVFYDLVARDVELATGAFALSQTHGHTRRKPRRDKTCRGTREL